MKHGNLGQKGLFYHVAFVLRLIKSFNGISGYSYCASTVRARYSTADTTVLRWAITASVSNLRLSHCAHCVLSIVKIPRPGDETK